MMQVQAQALVESLASDAQRTRTGRALTLIVLGLASALGVAGLVAAGGWLMVQAAIYGWQTSDWDRLDFGSITLVLLLFLFLLPLMAYAVQPKVRPELTQSILDALARGDAPLAPLAALQPEPAADVPAGHAVTLCRLRQVPLGNARWRGLVITLTIVPMEFLAFTFALQSLLGVDSFSFQVFGLVFGLSLTDLELIAGSASLIGALGAFALLSSSSLRRLRITADESGISWHSGGWRKHLSLVRWAQVRAFYCMAYLASSASPRMVYIVDAGDHIFAWIIGRVAPRRELDESEGLAGIIRLRTRLPLRDISELAVTVCQYQRQPDELLRLGMTPDAVAALQRLTYRSLRLLWLLPAALLIILGFIVPLVGMQRLEDYQHGYFVGLPQKIHAETPIYFDSLAASDNQWDVERPSKDNGEWNIGFRDGTYQLTGKSGYTVDAYPDVVFRDAAVEVTAVQRSKAAAGNDGVGLLLRADTDQNMIVFAVSPTDGSWWLSHDYYYNPAHPNDSWYGMDSGTSAFVHMGAGAANTLLVLARGPTYLLYVNNHFLSAYTGRYHEDPHPVFSGNGNAGVYVNDGATTGIFSNFSVYPVQSPPSLSYV